MDPLADIDGRLACIYDDTQFSFSVSQLLRDGIITTLDPSLYKTILYL